MSGRRVVENLSGIVPEGASLKRLIILAFVFASCVPAQSETDEGCISRKTNEERTSRNIPALIRDARVDRIAEHHSQQMAADETIYHNQSLSSELPSYEYGGENVGMGPDCLTIHEAFMGSPGHRENILERDYERFGVGVARNGDTIYVTVDFFTPKQQAKPHPRPRVVPPSCR